MEQKSEQIIKLSTIYYEKEKDLLNQFFLKEKKIKNNIINLQFFEKYFELVTYNNNYYFHYKK